MRRVIFPLENHHTGRSRQSQIPIVRAVDLVVAADAVLSVAVFVIGTLVGGAGGRRGVVGTGVGVVGTRVGVAGTGVGIVGTGVGAGGVVVVFVAVDSVRFVAVFVVGTIVAAVGTVVVSSSLM